MNLDGDGFIRRMPSGPFQPAFATLLAAVVERLPTALGSRLVALYV